MKTTRTHEDEATYQFRKRIDMKEIRRQLEHLSAEKLKHMFYECCYGGAKFLARAAICVEVLQKHGYPIEGMLMYEKFLKIADGRILPELVWMFMEAPKATQMMVENLPLSQQDRLTKNPVIPVVKPGSDGAFETLAVDLRSADKATVKQAVSPSGVRSPEQQIDYLGEQKVKTHAASMRAQDDDDDVSEALVIEIRSRLTDSEHEALKINAVHERITMMEMIRVGLRRGGALTPPIL